MTVAVDTSTKVREFLDVLDGRNRILILSHNNPDPDSMGGGLGVRFLLEESLGVETTYAYRGQIFRAENLEMVRRLGIGMVDINDLDLSRFDGLVVVDTQPGFGHTVLPDDMPVDGVIDHHVPPPDTSDRKYKVRFRDVRTDVGATCSILAGYLMELGLEIPARVATGMLYGIRTDTADLSRNTSDLDERAYMHLMARADRQALAEISKPSVPKNYFTVFRHALNQTRIFGRVVVCSLGVTDNPLIVAEVADLLLRLDEAEWVVTGGLYNNTYYISVRAKDYGRDAWSLLRDILDGEGSFGGHGTVGGGSIPVKDLSQRSLRRLERRLLRNLLSALGESHTPGAILA